MYISDDFYLILLPIIPLIMINITRKMNKDFEMREVGIESHILGIMYLYPLIISNPSSIPLFFIFFVLSFALMVTTQCYIKSKGRTTSAIKYGVFGFILGIIILIIGFIVSIDHFKAIVF